MKVHGHSPQDVHGATVRRVAKAHDGAPAKSEAAAAAAAAPARAGTPSAATAPAATAPVESTVEMAARKSPPGLVRVADRLEAMGAEGRSGGQSNALAQITRNLQRYLDTQGSTTAEAPPPSAAAALADAAEAAADQGEPTPA